VARKDQSHALGFFLGAASDSPTDAYSEWVGVSSSTTRVASIGVGRETGEGTGWDPTRTFSGAARVPVVVVGGRKAPRGARAGRVLVARLPSDVR
jgi:hypothetical protein